VGRARGANFDYAWSQLTQMWSDPALGEPGQRAIQDRQQGACKWRDGQGQCWNWFTGYRDPIAFDPEVKDDTAAALDQATRAVQGIPALAWAGLAILAVGVFL
jgi:hypothetical protein